MDSPKHRPSVRRASAFLESLERRDRGRTDEPRELRMFWHHDPSRVCRYVTIDVSTTGARLRTELPLPEGMTGVVMDLGDESVPFERVAMVVWSRSVRDGDSSHHEAGIRFL